MKKTILFTLLLSLFLIKAFSKDTLRYENLKRFSSIGIGGGSSHYFGDIHPYSNKSFKRQSTLDMPQWNISLSYNKYFGKHFSLKSSFNWIHIMADDEHFASKDLDSFYSLYLRNLHFRNNIKELSLVGTLYLNSSKMFSPYLFGGFALYAHNPQAREKYDSGNAILGRWISLHPLNTSGQGFSNIYPKAYSLLAVSVPFGVGVQSRFKNNFIMSLEINLRYNGNDCLDDIFDSGFPNPNELNPTTAYLSNRAGEDFSAYSGKSRIANAQYIYINKLSLTGNPTPSAVGEQVLGYPDALRGTSKNDTYFTSNISISYIFKQKK